MRRTVKKFTQTMSTSNPIQSNNKLGHRRRPSIGKELPISALLIDITKQSKKFESISRDGISPDLLNYDRPPLFYNLHQVNEETQHADDVNGDCYTNQIVNHYDDVDVDDVHLNDTTNVSDSNKLRDCRKNFMANMLSDNDDDDDDDDVEDENNDSESSLDRGRESISPPLECIESHPLDDKEAEVLREQFNLTEFRKKLAIAEALAQASILTTPAAKRRLMARKVELEFDPAQPFQDDDGNDYIPPRELLIYLVRMGSFNSAPKINNTDSQDDDINVPHGLTPTDLVRHCQQMRGESRPPLIARQFLKPIKTNGLITNDITDGMRVLKLNAFSKVCSPPITSPNHLRILQWNILSQTLGQSNDNFVSCPDEALTWECRKYQIVQEIIQNDPDVVCLQEVDHFKFLQNILAAQDYEGVFFPKPDSPCLYIKENNGPDGCAIFYKKSKFEMLNYSTRVLEVWRVQSNQVAVAANLRVRESGKEFTVGTTHLKARHGALLSKLRNEQGKDLLQFINSVAENRPIILCGDFNAEPIEPVYSTIINNKSLGLSSAYADLPVSERMADMKIFQTTTEPESITRRKHSNCGSSLTPADISAAREPLYTTWKIREDGEVCHTIDYVFYTKDHMKVNNCLMFPDSTDLGQDRAPSFTYPSDHFSLVCDFEFTNGE